MVCPNCGYTNQPGNRFCVRCGIDTAAYRAPEPAPATGVPDAPAPSQPPAAPLLAPPPAPAAPPPDAPPPAPAPPSPWGVPASPAGPPPGAAPGAMPPPPGVMGPPPGAPGGPPPGPPNPFAPPAPAGPPGYPQWGYGQYPPPYPPSGSWAPQTTNGLAVASLVLGIVGWLACGVGSVLAVIFGFVSQAQIRESRGRQGGTGMAKAGIILGFVGIGLIVLFFVVGAISGSSQS